MTSDDKSQDSGDALLHDPSRREFVAISAAVGLAAGAGRAAAAEGEHRHANVVETDVTIPTGDGTCDAAYIHPARGKHPGVIIWTDVFGLRPTFRQMGRRLAAAGYSVLIPNPFYRTQKSPVYTEEEVAKFSFQDPKSRARMAEDTGPINKAGAIETDSKALVGFLDSQAQVDANRKIGTQGHCMGGPLVFRTAASQSDRIGAGATLHGGGLVTDMPDSPHLLVPKIHAQMYIAIAASDDMRQPDAKDKLKAAFEAAKDPKTQDSTVLVYANTFHGWTVPDMPHQPSGQSTYNKAEADRAWAHVLTLYRKNLA